MYLQIFKRAEGRRWKQDPRLSLTDEVNARNKNAQRTLKGLVMNVILGIFKATAMT